jgi:hypothetical protein
LAQVEGMKDTKKVSVAQEKRTATTYGGQVNVMSGAGWMRKADVRTERYLIENKTSVSKVAKSYSVKAIDLRDLRKQAAKEGRVPILQFDLGGHRYVVLDEDDFLEEISDK